jgi:hypothetical protein
MAPHTSEAGQQGLFKNVFAAIVDVQASGMGQ